MKKIVVTGPECSGKTTLAKRLAQTLQVPWVPEFSRQYLNSIDRPYTYEDLVEIAEGQIVLEKQLCQGPFPYLVCDTYMLVLKIWSQEKFGKVAPFIEAELEKSKDRLYLLCDYHIPYEPDPLRENPHDRHLLFEKYQDQLEQLKFNYLIVEGTVEKRLKDVLERLEKF